MRSYEHLKRAISNSSVIEKPYKHVVVDNALPWDFYDELMDNLNTTSFASVSFYPGDHTKVCSNNCGCWEFLNEMNKVDFSQMLSDKFQTPNGRSHCFLHKDTCGYEISPHRDIPSKLISYMLYLPRDPSHKELGTMICKPKREIEGSREKWFEWDDFEHTTIDFIPNRFFAFAPSENSFHAVKHETPNVNRFIVRGFVFDTTKKLPGYLSITNL